MKKTKYGHCRGDQTTKISVAAEWSGEGDRREFKVLKIAQGGDLIMTAES